MPLKVTPIMQNAQDLDKSLARTVNDEVPGIFHDPQS
jgi:hypothetical protein